MGSHKITFDFSGEILTNKNSKMEKLHGKSHILIEISAIVWENPKFLFYIKVGQKWPNCMIF